MKCFRINRQKWFRGKGADSSRLLNEYGQMCCLGFLALEAGYKEEEIKKKSTPREPAYDCGIKGDVAKLVEGDVTPSGKRVKNNAICDQLMLINDSMMLSDYDREVKLTAEFAKIGLQPLFYDDPS